MNPEHDPSSTKQGVVESRAPCDEAEGAPSGTLGFGTRAPLLPIAGSKPLMTGSL
jgi:hypothetical protein